MTSPNPFGEFRVQCMKVLRVLLKSAYPDYEPPSLALDLPPSTKFGELTSSISFDLSKVLGITPIEVAEKIIEGFKAIDWSKYPLLDSIEAAGQGYINFHVNYGRLASITLESVRSLGDEYGYVKTDKPERVIVEHTSANPIHPIHVGHARNSVLGDSLARILEARGHRVYRHYYIDDVGRQSAIVAYGYKKLGRPKPEGKPDHFIGAIYSITSCLLEVRRLKRELERAREAGEEFSDIQRRLDEWVSVAVELKEKFPELFDMLIDELNKVEDPEGEVNRLNQDYEAGREEAKSLIREVCHICLEGFKETFNRAGISFDSWDWESSYLWNGDVAKYLNMLRRTPYVYKEGEVLEFDADGVAEALKLKKALGVREDYEIPSLTLTRADGTTLYTTRDIAYTIWKFGRADRVINVVGMEQKLAQMQLKLALYALGFKDEAEKLVHFAYNLVRIPGRRISGRRGRYVTFDEVMDEAVKRAYIEVSERSPNLPEEERGRISELVGIGAVKYALLETDPIKPVTFKWDRVLNFEMNSAPYLQYSHARACSIIRRASRRVEAFNPSLLKEPIEREIILMIARFPEIFIEAAENLRPSLIADFTYRLADKFNTFYASTPVIKAEPKELGDARLLLVDAVRVTLRNSLKLLGIEAPERM